MGSIPGLGRSPGGGHGNPLQCSCLENPMDKGAWWATVCRVAKNWTWLKWLSKHAHMHGCCHNHRQKSLYPANQWLCSLHCYRCHDQLVYCSIKTQAHVSILFFVFWGKLFYTSSFCATPICFPAFLANLKSFKSWGSCIMAWRTQQAITSVLRVLFWFKNKPEVGNKASTEIVCEDREKVNKLFSGAREQPEDSTNRPRDPRPRHFWWGTQHHRNADPPTPFYRIFCKPQCCSV